MPEYPVVVRKCLFMFSSVLQTAYSKALVKFLSLANATGLRSASLSEEEGGKKVKATQLHGMCVQPKPRILCGCDRFLFQIFSEDKKDFLLFAFQ